MTETIRHTAVAGHFYTSVPGKLREELASYLSKPAAPKAKAYGVLVPHAGYIYSGAVCGHALASVEIPGTVLILHTKHQLGGGTFSLAGFREWETPLGKVRVDGALQKSLAAAEGIDVSNFPHFQEHAAEVVLPFLQQLNPDVKVCVISVSHAPLETVQAVGAGIASAILSQDGGDTLIVASSDMNHYEDHETTLAKDKLALDKLAQYDTQGMIDVCFARDISMCGVHATALMLEACRGLGASKVELLEHTTSGEYKGQYGQVVGYASARVL
ncbi:MAG: AmmeMemoRadiSam system protein B [Planctomycetes bacterium]|nr:AmmeMemoRadiSam system protein B [Planctomycetota bacterium]